jgi:hypothetical protein
MKGGARRHVDPAIALRQSLVDPRSLVRITTHDLDGSTERRSVNVS